MAFTQFGPADPSEDIWEPLDLEAIMQKHLKTMFKDYISTYYPCGYMLRSKKLYAAWNGTEYFRVLRETHPQKSFKEFLENKYKKDVQNTYKRVFKEIMEDSPFSVEEKKYIKENRNLFMSVIQENLKLNWQEKNWMDNVWACNLVVSNGDDTSNFAYKGSRKWRSYHHSLSRLSGMMVLAHLQGYSTKRFRKIYRRYRRVAIHNEQQKMEAMKKAYPFITSCFESLRYASKTTLAFVICKAMTFGSLMDWAENKRDVHLVQNKNRSEKSKWAENDTQGCVGVCDFQHGDAANMGIILEKDVVIPYDKIYTFVPDAAWGHTAHDMYKGYNLHELFGFKVIELYPNY